MTIITSLLRKQNELLEEQNKLLESLDVKANNASTRAYLERCAEDYQQKHPLDTWLHGNPFR